MSSGWSWLPKDSGKQWLNWCFLGYLFTITKHQCALALICASVSYVQQTLNHGFWRMPLSIETSLSLSFLTSELLDCILFFDYFFPLSWNTVIYTFSIHCLCLYIFRSIDLSITYNYFVCIYIRWCSSNGHNLRRAFVSKNLSAYSSACIF